MPAYMRYEGIDGPVKRKKEKWVEALSVDFGPNKNFALATSKNLREFMASVTEITVVRKVDATSQALFKESVWGGGRKVVIELVAPGPNVTEKAPYMTIELEGTLIATYSYSASGGDGGPYETLSLSFTKLTFSTAPQPSQAATTGAASTRGRYTTAK